MSPQPSRLDGQEPQASKPRNSTKAPRPQTSRRRRYADLAAKWIVTAGGLTIIVSILAILLFIVVEVLPLVSGAAVSPGSTAALHGTQPEALVTDEYRTHAATLSADGTLRVIRLQDGQEVDRRHVVSTSPGSEDTAEERPTITDIQGHGGAQVLSAALSDGSVVMTPMDWEVAFDANVRRIVPTIGETQRFPLDPNGAPLGAFTGRHNAEGTSLVAAQVADGRVLVRVRSAEENLFTGELTTEWFTGEVDCAFTLTRLIVDRDLKNLYAGAATGELIWWSLDGATPSAPRVVSGSSPAVTAMTLLIGDDTLVVGRESGELSIWFPTRRQGLAPELLRIRDFPTLSSPIAHLAPSGRGKSFAALNTTGDLGLYHSTAHRVLLQEDSPTAEASALFVAPKADALIVAGSGQLHELLLDNPHPEPSFATFFAPTHYEGYPEPAYVWQSTGGTDEFEPKLSLVPLIVGTFKGTLYSLLLAVPLGVLGAMYTSRFMHWRLKRIVKPTVEIMAALPSVVLGFMAGLWLAPRVEEGFTALMLMLVFLPILVVISGLLWAKVPRATRNRVPVGSEALLYAAVIVVGAATCIKLGPAAESMFFAGDFKEWLLHITGMQYDQRNAVVVGLAMGFAVIPIIFSIAEDAFSNVPNNLVSGSLALGANRWQTVTRVVLPTASPGIFSAIMIGFGRAVGETMIVLMATGNTPIMDWSPFNGFRTLSANIAVEIPEAPHGGTLYRTLFLAALLLFIFTFVTNTVAELVRQRLRTRYAQT